MIAFEKQMERLGTDTFADIWRLFVNALGTSDGATWLQHWMMSEGKEIYQQAIAANTEEAYRYLYYVVTNMIGKQLNITEDLPVTIARALWDAVRFGKTNDVAEIRTTMVQLLKARMRMLMCAQIREGSP